MNFADRFYSVGELVDLTGYHPDSIYRAIARGALAAAKPGGKWLIDGAAIDCWLQPRVTEVVASRPGVVSAGSRAPTTPARRGSSDARPSFSGAGRPTELNMSVEKTESRTGATYKVRRRHAGVHHARRFTTLEAAERFERKVRTSRRQANFICSTSLFRSGMTYVPSTTRPGHTVWKLHTAIDPLTPGERRDLADALLLAEWGAALEEPRVLLLDLALATDEQLLWAFA